MIGIGTIGHCGGNLGNNVEVSHLIIGARPDQNDAEGDDQPVTVAQHVRLTGVGGRRAGQGELRDIIEQRIDIFVGPCNPVGQPGIITVGTRGRNGHGMGRIDYVFRGKIIGKLEVRDRAA